MNLLIDWFLPLVICRTNSEKRQKGRVSVSQSRFLSVTNELGYQSIVCYSSEDAIQKIKEYLKNGHHAR